MSNLGLNKHVQKKYAEKTIEGESEVDGNLDIIKELEEAFAAEDLKKYAQIMEINESLDLGLIVEID